MQANALFELLPDFGPRHARTEPATAPQRPPAGQPPAVDTDALVAAAVAQARAEAEARLEAAHRAALDAEREAHAEEMKALAATLGADAGKTIAASLEALENRILDLVGGQAARMLGTVLADDLQRRAIAALATAVRGAIRDAEGARIRVGGPASLYEALRGALGDHAGKLDFTEAPGFDLTVTVDDVVFETRMAEWSQALSEILA
jgi:hypothetical protein